MRTKSVVHKPLSLFCYSSPSGLKYPGFSLHSFSALLLQHSLAVTLCRVHRPQSPWIECIQIYLVSFVIISIFTLCLILKKGQSIGFIKLQRELWPKKFKCSNWILLHVVLYPPILLHTTGTCCFWNIDISQPCLKSLSGPNCFQGKNPNSVVHNHIHNWSLFISPASSCLLPYTAANILSWICNSLNSACFHSSLPLHKVFPKLKSPSSPSSHS